MSPFAPRQGEKGRVEKPLDNMPKVMQEVLVIKHTLPQNLHGHTEEDDGNDA